MNVVVGLRTANLGSVIGALDHLGVEHRVSDDPAVVGAAGRLILPGVGAFDAGMDELARTDLVAPIVDAIRGRGAPILGVCLGMQLLLAGSDEGRRPGLGLVAGRATRLGSTGAKVPHVGFDVVEFPEGCALGRDIPAPAHVYFTHSYGLRQPPSGATAGVCPYDGGFAATLEQESVMGVQFHPEKSQATGLRVLANFFRATEPAA